MVTERVEGEKRSARHNSAMCSSAAHAREAGGDMAGRCTGCWCARTVERELPPVAERHGRSSRTAAAATCQRAGGYGAGLGTLAAAAAVLVMARGGWTAREAKSLRGEGWRSKIASRPGRAGCQVPERCRLTAHATERRLARPSGGHADTTKARVRVLGHTSRYVASFGITHLSGYLELSDIPPRSLDPRSTTNCQSACSAPVFPSRPSGPCADGCYHSH